MKPEDWWSSDKTGEGQTRASSGWRPMLNWKESGWCLEGAWRYKTRHLGEVDTGNRGSGITSSEVNMKTMRGWIVHQGWESCEKTPGLWWRQPIVIQNPWPVPQSGGVAVEETSQPQTIFSSSPCTWSDLGTSYLLWKVSGSDGCHFQAKVLKQQYRFHFPFPLWLAGNIEALESSGMVSCGLAERSPWGRETHLSTRKPLWTNPWIRHRLLLWLGHYDFWNCLLLKVGLQQGLWRHARLVRWRVGQKG